LAYVGFSNVVLYMDKKINMNIQTFKNKKIVWFNIRESRSLTKRYKDSFLRMDNFFMKEKVSHTIEVDLSIDEDQILNGMDKGTKYEVRRCLKENLVIENINEISTFIEFYNHFAKIKNLNLISKDNLNFSPDLILRGIKNIENQFLSIHVYVVNESGAIARLLYSATNIELFDDNKALIGRANRLLHYDDMLYFKSNGYKRYDLGGYAHNTEDKLLKGINKFKKGFGGSVREVYIYEPIIINVLKNLYGKVSPASR
jgi:lipid II:glycine glycyltransferase (peptidoglycan interpeptide bridge formation enzyme)